MAFKSLSAVINTNIAKAQVAQMGHIKLGTNTALQTGIVRTIGDLRDEDQDVLTWGTSTWGVQKVTASYKPTD